MADTTEHERDGTLPTAVIDRAERLTRQARQAVDESEQTAYLRARRELLAEHGFCARVREDETGDVLVCYPAEWTADGTIQPDRINDIDRGIERTLSGVGDDSWEAVDAHNREIVAAVADEYGPDHAANTAALADFAGNHYKKPIDQLTGEELALFLEEYYPRNVWPTDDQKAVVEESIRLVFEVAETSLPTGCR